jgi:hypothetical protein
VNTVIFHSRIIGLDEKSLTAVGRALSQSHALRCLAEGGGRLHRPDDAQAERRELDVRAALLS